MVRLAVGDGAVLTTGNDHQLGTEVQPSAGGVFEGTLGVEPLQILVGGLDHAGEGDELFGPLSRLLHVVNEGGAAVGIVAEQGAVAGGLEGGRDNVCAGLKHGGDRTGVYCIGGAGQFGQLVGDGIQGPLDIEFVFRGAISTDGGLGDGGSLRGGFEGQLHRGSVQVRVDAFTVGVRAVVADKVGGVAEAACANGDVHGGSAGVGVGFSVVLVDDVYECFTDYSQHGFNSTRPARSGECVFVGISSGFAFPSDGFCWLAVGVHKLPSVSSDF